MPTWVMKCSICDRTFEAERSTLPVGEVAPVHPEVLGEVTYERTRCLGSGQAWLQTKRPRRR
jgi:hypothetical protein